MVSRGSHVCVVGGGVLAPRGPIPNLRVCVSLMTRTSPRSRESEALTHLRWSGGLRDTWCLRVPLPWLLVTCCIPFWGETRVQAWSLIIRFSVS